MNKMFYQPLNSKIEYFDKCFKITNLLLMTSTTVFTMLTFIYLKELSESLQHADFSSIEETFEYLKECIINAHICDPG